MRPISHTVMMQRKHGWLVTFDILKKTHQLLTEMKGELRSRCGLEQAEATW